MEDEFYRRKEVTLIVTFLIVVALMTVFFGFWTYGTNKVNDLKDLANLGSYINMVVAIASILTVGLVFYGVRAQGLEFQVMNQKLQKQIESNENQEILNRTINEINQWNTIKNNSIGNYGDSEMKEFSDFFDWIDLIKSSDLSNKFDVELIENVIFSDNTTRSYLSDLLESVDGQRLHLYENNQRYIDECDEFDGVYFTYNHNSEVSRYYLLLQIQRSLEKGANLISGYYDRQAKIKLDDALR